MGIQPIDLQTMYSQLSNLSKTMSGTQQAQLTEAMQQQSNIQKSLENVTKVHETSNEKADTNSVNQNGSNSSAFRGGQKKKNKDEENTQDEPLKTIRPNYSHLGTIIDITR
ncbi:MAG: hypothetical protein IJ688_10150 [Treponema sp.]|nr:hypothetical protein [Treponema sp.]